MVVNRLKVAAAAGLVGVLGLISISGTQVERPSSGEPAFPTAESVGPSSEPTIEYTDCFFDSSQNNEVVENRILNCEEDGLLFAADATGIIIRNSVINGGMYTLGNTPGDPGVDTYPKAKVFTVEDSRIIQDTVVGGQDRAACCAHFTIKRSYIQGTHSGIGGHNNVLLEGNFITTDGTDSHSSGIRILKNSVIDNNTITCKPVTPGSDGGCSAAGVFYAEDLSGASTPSFNLTITDNYFRRGTTSGGAPGGPWNATRFINCTERVDCTGFTFTGNQFELGWNTDGGEFPFYGGNTWASNTWTDGASASSGQAR